MKQKIQLLASLILVLLVSTSCILMGPSLKGNGNVVKETRRVGDFDEIKVSHGMNVYISQGNETEVVVNADENLLDAIITEVEGNTLIIKSDQNIRRATTKKIFVTTPNISMIKTSSGSNVFSETVIRSKNIDISSSSGSNIKLQIDGGNVDASSSSGSNIKLKGEAKSFSGNASSGSNIKAGELTTEKCEARVSSGANIWIKTKEKLEAHASSGGNIFYYGNPKSTDIEKSSGGNVINK